MKRKFFLKTERIGFSKWTQNDIELAKSLWGKGYAKEAANATKKLFAGHNPNNTASRKVLGKLCFLMSRDMRTGKDKMNGDMVNEIKECFDRCKRY